MKEKLLITGATVYGEQEVYEGGFVAVEDGKMIGVGPAGECPSEEGYEVVFLSKQHILIPGMIDIHVHGASGADMMDATPEALHRVASALPKEGVTSFLATTMTESKERIEAALMNAALYESKAGEAEMLGIHLEGPFLHPKRMGAQPEAYLLVPSTELFETWQQLAQGRIRIVTLAPEQLGGLELVQYLQRTEVIASMGHSDATYEETERAIEAGATHVTHMFNAMRGLHHREPGLLGAALVRDELMAEIIVDGIHSHREMVRLAWKQKGADRIILITDAMRAKGLVNGTYTLGGQAVHVEENKASLQDGTLAGSVLKMNEALRNMKAYTECTLRDLLQMSAVNPARQLGVWERKGSIAVGKDADLVVLNEDFEVVMTWCKGKFSIGK